MHLSFHELVDELRDLSLDEKIEIQDIVEKSIIDEKRKIILANCLESKKEYSEGKLHFSDNISELKKSLMDDE